MRTSPWTPEKIKLANRLRSKGKSDYSIAEATGVSRSGVRKMFARQEAKSGVAPADGKVSTAKASEVSAQTTAPSIDLDEVVAQAHVVLAALPVAPTSTDEDGASLAIAKELSALFVKTIRDSIPEAKAGAFPATSLAQLVKIALELGDRVAMLTPPAKLKPEDDPQVQEATRTLSKRFEQMIEAAEANEQRTGICHRCKQNLPPNFDPKRG
jgi:hypothetical protein